MSPYVNRSTVGVFPSPKSFTMIFLISAVLSAGSLTFSLFLEKTMANSLEKSR